MAQPLDVKSWLATGRQLAGSGRQLGTDLVEQGRLATDQIAAVVEELVNRGSRDRIEEVRETVRGEVQPLRTLVTEIRDHLLNHSQLVADRIAAAVEDLRDAVRDEVQRQLSTLRVATTDDLVAVGQSIRDDLAMLSRNVRDDLAVLERRLVANDAAGIDDTGAPFDVSAAPDGSTVVDLSVS